MPERPPRFNTNTKSRIAKRNPYPKESPSKRGYDSAWKRLRATVLHKQPLCVHCLDVGRTEAATELDHIVPIRLRPDLRLVVDNLQPLCKSCHSKKTGNEKV
jgi:5-methylcytosine-specific restriction protein A